MSETLEKPGGRNSIVDQFQIAVVLDAEPVDWDYAVARFLLAVVRQNSPVSVVAPVEQPSDDILCIKTGCPPYASPIG